MKKLFPGKSLAEIFKVAFADQLFVAKKNFIESSAAYSLVVYFLQAPRAGMDPCGFEGRFRAFLDGSKGIFGHFHAFSRDFRAFPA